jgi:hypothetical protein
MVFLTPGQKKSAVLSGGGFFAGEKLPKGINGLILLSLKFPSLASHLL